MTTILVIEDTHALREEIMEVLSCEGFDVFGAEDGLVGIEIAQTQLPDLIICDVMMPHLNGYDTLKALRQKHSTAAIPFIFLTAKSNKDDVRQGMDLGADDYLTKPFTTTALLAAITARLQKQSTITEWVKTELNALRSSISLSLPHELRTPLNSIMGFSELLIDFLSGANQPDMLEMSQNIYTSAKLLHRIIQNFLLYAELEIAATYPERSKLSNDYQITSLADSDITQLLKEKAAQFDRTNDLQTIMVEDAAINLSSSKFRKIVEEIVDNCFKYSNKNTLVHVASFLDDRHLIIKFIDQGRGMTAEQIKSIGAYMQFERKLHEQQGSGLGLTIASRLTELHGGKLTIESSPGYQTTVFLSLPLAPIDESK